MTRAIFHAFKSALDGSGERWDYVTKLTFDEARDPTRFPYGRHTEPSGRAYVWTHALMPAHVPPERAAIRALGRTTRPVPSAASAIMGKMTTKL